MKKNVKIWLFSILLLMAPVGSINAESIHNLEDPQEGILVVKEKLTKLGFYDDTLDGVIEEELESAIKLFQAHHDLQETGVMNEATEKKVDSELENSYFFGDSNEEIIELHSHFITLGYSESTPTEDFDEALETALIDFQKNHADLNVTGVIDTKTLSEINSEIEKIIKVDVSEKETPEENLSAETSEEAGETLEENATADEEVVIEEDPTEEAKEVVEENTAEDVDAEKTTETEVSEEDSQADSTDDSTETTELEEKQEITASKAAPMAIAETTEAPGPLERGDTGEAVRVLQEDLIKLGFGEWKITTTFGPTTESALKDFQSYHGLTANGVYDNATEEKVQAELQASYFYDDRNAEILKLQKYLIELDYGYWNPTVRFGPTTRSAVIAFQEDYSNLRVTGVLDTKTQEKLEQEATKDLQRGMRSTGVKELQENLIKLGFGNWNPTITFGPTTESALKDFQKYHGLTANGILDNKTKEELQAELDGTYFYDDRNAEILKLQQYLIGLGYGSWNPTERFGPTTRTAVIAFQKDHSDLKVTGVLDTKTQKKLIEAEGKDLQRGMRSNKVKELQKDLIKLGFGDWNPTLIFGPTTESALKDFQNYHGLTANGIYNNQTAEKLQTELQESYFFDERHSEILEHQHYLIKLGYGDWNPTLRFGPTTRNAVEEFQEDTSGLKLTGVLDTKTQSTLKQKADNSLQIGMTSEKVKELQENLNRLGYSDWEPTNRFDAITVEAVKEFQKDHGLVVNGVANDKTLAKIEEVLNVGSEVISYTEYGVSLEDALKVQMDQLQQTDMYGNKPAFVSANFIDDVVSVSGTNLRAKATTKSNSYGFIQSGEEVVVLDKIKGQKLSSTDIWYKVEYDGKTGYVHGGNVSSNLKKRVSKDVNLNVRAEANTNSHVYGVLSSGQKINVVNKEGNWLEINYGAWRNPTRADVLEYLNPNNNDMFQHLELDTSVGVSAADLNNVLNGKGILQGKGQSFIDAGKRYVVNEIYLISHALLETGHGTSRLANGIEVGKNSKGEPVLVTKNNRKKLTEIETTYNMFGIGAADSDADRLGAIRAYESKWFTPEAAIVGGAKFIEDSYIHNDYKQNTLYKMRWNPANPGYPQYATDIEWAIKQIPNIKNLYDLLANPVLRFNVVQYS